MGALVGYRESKNRYVSVLDHLFISSLLCRGDKQDLFSAASPSAHTTCNILGAGNVFLTD